jgi:hypothetical protein
MVGRYDILHGRQANPRAADARLFGRRSAGLCDDAERSLCDTGTSPWAGTFSVTRIKVRHQMIRIGDINAD